MNKNCALVRRLGEPVYESCRSCELRLQNCIQFRGQIYTAVLVTLLLGELFLPLPALARWVVGATLVAVLLHFLRYVAKESHFSILNAARLRRERAQAVATAQELDRHVTQLKETRDQLVRADKLAAVGTLAAGVAHEINNPLQFVIGNLAFIRESMEGRFDPINDREVWEAVSDAESGGDRVKRIVSDLRTLARPDQGTPALVQVPEALQQVMRIAGSDLRLKARLVERYDSAPAVWGDPGKLGQVFLNLVVNALQAMDAARVSTNLLTIGVRTQGNEVVVEISDTGGGIAPENVPRLFEPFFTTKPRGVGTGLGLAICHTIISGMGGHITVDSEVGKGTCFRVTLPAATPQQASLPAQPASAASAPTPRRGRLMVVDDEPLVARAIARGLRQHEVVMHHSAASALQQLATDSRFDLILCDLMMPDAGGDALYEQVKNTNATLADRMLFLTGGAFNPASRQFIDKFEADRVLTKPLSEGQLEALVERRLGRT